MWAAGTVPLAVLLVDLLAGALGANPYQAMLQRSGLLAVVFLALSLACTPLRRLSGANWPARLRRPLGLLAFYWAALHLLLYVLDQGGLGGLPADLGTRPFIAVGGAAFALLFALYLTSDADAVRRLGARRWRRLHRAVYPAALLAGVHYFWAVKDPRGALLYLLVVGALLGLRLWWARGNAAKGNAAEGAVPHARR